MGSRRQRYASRPTPAPRATTSRTYATAGTRSVGLRVTDNGGKTATATLPVTVEHRRRLELRRRRARHARARRTTGAWASRAGPTLADTQGHDSGHRDRRRHARRARRPGVDPEHAPRASTASTAPRALPWTSRARRAITRRVLAQVGRLHRRRRLAIEFTPNFNDNDGGFLVDPNAPQAGGTFGVGIGRGDSPQQRLLRPADRRRVAPLRVRPRHDRSGGAADHPVRRRRAGQLSRRPTAAPAPATSPTRPSTSCRAPGRPVRRRRSRRGGDLRPRAERAPTIAEHYQSSGTNRRPVAAFTRHAEPGGDRQTGHLQRRRPRAIPTARSPSTSGTSTATAATRPTRHHRRRPRARYATERQHQRRAARDRQPHRRPTPTTQHARGRQPGADRRPSPSTPNPAHRRGSRRTSTPRPRPTSTARSPSTSGTSTATARYETDTRHQPRRRRAPTRRPAPSTSACGSPTTAARRRPRRAGDRSTTAASATTATPCSTRPASSTTGAWARPRADVRRQQGHEPRDRAGGATFGVPGRRRAATPTRPPASTASTTPPRRTSTSPARREMTVEFWLKWDAVRQRRRTSRWSSRRTSTTTTAASSSTRTHRSSAGRSASASGGGDSATTSSSPGRAPGSGTTTRFVLDTTAPAAQQITPYVDGQAGQLPRSSTAARAPGTFANSSLNFMSRDGAAPVRQRRPRRGGRLQPGAERGDDRRALRERPGRTAARPPPSRSRRTRPSVGQTVTFNAVASSDPDGTIAGYEWDLDGNGTYEQRQRFDHA